MAEEPGLSTGATATYVFSVDEVYKGIKLHFRHTTPFRFFYPPLVGMICMGFTIAFAFSEVPPPGTIRGLFLILGATFLLSPFLGLWLSRRKLAAIPIIDKPMTWWVDDKGISARGEGFEFSATWATAYSALVTPKGILVYPQKTVFYWLPTTAFASPAEWERARDIVMKHAPRCKTV